MITRIACLRKVARRVTGVHTLVALAATGCLSDSVEYEPRRDDIAMAEIASVWVQDGDQRAVLSLCEDVTVPDRNPADCQVEHIVRGGGRGIAHEESHGGVGCGGCPFDNVAYVRGTAEGGGLTGKVAVVGTVQLSATADDDPYAYPYDFDLKCQDKTTPCSITGTLTRDGRLAATFTPGSATPSYKPSHHLARTGAATCNE